MLVQDARTVDGFAWRGHRRAIKLRINGCDGSSPIASMYGIYANIWGILMVNVTIYSIHGSYGSWIPGLSFKTRLVYISIATVGQMTWTCLEFVSLITGSCSCDCIGCLLCFECTAQKAKVSRAMPSCDITLYNMI